MAFSDENNGLMQGNDFEYFATHDGGVTWTALSPWLEIRDGEIAAVPGMADTYIQIGADLVTNIRGSSYTIDGGLTWYDVYNWMGGGPDVDGYRLAVLDEDHAFAGGFSSSPTSGGIYKWSGGSLLRMAHLAVSDFSGDKSVRAAPNPVSGILNITGKSISRIMVTDMLGKQMITTDSNGLDNISLDLDFLAKGVYMVKVTNNKGIAVFKVVKQ